MASWRQNKIVGIVAGIVFVLALVFVVRGLMSLRGEKAELTEAEKKGITPAEEIAPRK